MPQMRTDLLVDTLGYLCLKSTFKDALFESDFASFMNQITTAVTAEDTKVRQGTQSAKLMKKNGIY